MSRILVIDDETYMGWIIDKAFADTGHQVSAVITGNEGIEKIEKENFDLLFLDLRLPDIDGMDVLEKIKTNQPDLPIIIITAHGSIDTAIESMKRGAFDYVTKPFDIDELLLLAQRALEVRKLKGEVNYLRTQVKLSTEEVHLKSNNPNMQEVYDIVNQIAATTATVLITGESGTGKEVIGRSIHKISDRACGPFIAVNCGAIPENLLESELFGHEKGAFTGAVQRKIGRFELANGGTIFLDEIGEMSMAMQVKLLRVIQERELQRVGGNTNISIDVRIIAATNRNLLKSIQEGIFREDLYYRLNVVPIELPSLRNRKEDIPLLVEAFVKKYDTRGKIKGVTDKAMGLMSNYKWPGNIRELQNVVERVVLLSRHEYIDEDSLPKELVNEDTWKSNVINFPKEGINLEEVEKELILKALELSKGNQTRAAELLSITRSALIYRMQKYDIK